MLFHLGTSFFGHALGRPTDGATKTIGARHPKRKKRPGDKDQRTVQPARGGSGARHAAAAEGVCWGWTDSTWPFNVVAAKHR